MRVKILAVMLLGLMLAGCGKGAQLSEYDKVHNNLMDMKSYATDATVKYISNNGENEYVTKQYALSDGRYRMETTKPDEYNGNVILFDGKMVWQYNPSAEENKVRVNAPDKPERAELILFSFVENMVKSMDVGLEASSIDESMCTVLEAKIPGDNKFLASEKLWVDNESLCPKRLVVYDKDGKEKIVVDYENFEYNCEIEDEKFVIKN